MPFGAAGPRSGRLTECSETAVTGSAAHLADARHPQARALVPVGASRTRREFVALSSSGAFP
jgi:hypothetical protein